MKTYQVKDQVMASARRSPKRSENISRRTIDS